MRWQNLTIEAAEQASLPGYREPAVIRHFDAPEALDTRFYEIRAKSALNRVPQKSRMPFPWTINPYRGCSHACAYCLRADTPVLMGDGKTKSIEELAVGDVIFGTVFDGKHRRYTRTEARDKWTTLKPAYRTVLEDGTELVTSGDHRFLTDRGWKHVAERRRCQRPHLTLSDCLPVIRRKRDIEGTAIEPDAKLKVVAVEPLGVTIPLYDITTGTGDYISNGVVSHNCFARPTHTYLGFDAGRDFEKEIVVKVNAPELVRAEVSRPSWKREHVAMGTNTDPYQWVESRYRLMPPIWEALRDSSTPCSILTKSPLVLRDLPILRSIREAGVPVQAAFSVPTLEEKAWRASEPHTPHPRKRLEAVGELTKAGIPTGILIAPLMPGINDDPRQVDRILELAGEMGAVSVGGICLHLRGEVRGVFMDWLRQYRPDLVEHYEQLYAGRAYASREEQARIGRLIRYQPREGAPRWSRGTRDETPARPPAAAALQERLF